ncbi:MAG: ATP-binding protein [Prevotella sp.]|nr:ATP-binding protein [Prevotella sp.]
MKTEILEKAQVIMQNRRHNAIVENDRRIDEINKKIPEIKEINDRLFNTGRKIINVVMAGKKAGKNEWQIKADIERVKRDNLSIQQRSKMLLIQNGFCDDYLDIHYNCKKCGDTGYVEGKMCECFKKLCGKLEADEINRYSNLELSSFDTFNLSYYTGDEYNEMESIFEYTQNYAEKFSPDSSSILMYGKTGLGKTHLSLAIANRVLEKGYSVIYDSVINILSKIEEEHFSYNRKREMINLVMQTDLLIIDDLGTENRTPFYDSTIYNIINTRLNYRKPVIISTNLDVDEIRESYDERVTSRITTQYTILKFFGTDIRWQKKENKKKMKEDINNKTDLN